VLTNKEDRSVLSTDRRYLQTEGTTEEFTKPEAEEKQEGTS